MTTLPRPVHRATPQLAAVGAEQLSLIITGLRSPGWLLFLFIALAVPAVPFGLLNEGAFMTREYAAVALLMFSVILPPKAWQDKGKKGGIGYFHAMPVSRTRHIAVRTGAGWSLIATAGCVLLAVALLIDGNAGIPPQGWIAPLLGATALYLVFSGFYAGMRQPHLWVIGLLWLPLGFTRLVGTAAEQAVRATLESGMTLFLGMEAVGAEEAEVLQFANLQSWLTMSFLSVGLALAIFMVAALRHQDI